MTEGKTYIYGRHALVEALTNSPRSVKKVFLMPQFSDAELDALIKKSGVSVSTMSDGKNPQGSDSSKVRQGIIGLLALGGLLKPFKEFADELKVSPDTCLVLLDELQDPHNFGAIIRSAAALGVTAILVPEHNQVPITSAVVKVSAGMAFRIPLVTVPNVNTALRELKTKGFWIYGMDETATHNLNTEKFDAPTVFVMGNEGDGIRQKTLEICDVLLSIPMNKRCESMNVAASAAVTLYAWSIQHPDALI
ncbi:MAG: 23S rRNA (guanosine(2251)-2'-O)-methyltransferase RlmB [bacterium]|nr:23S rRNA (guanosine(2251)-2'-O)-methyltransferase RlmB [bacterium]